MIDLPYFDAPRMLCIDPMHNLFLGTAKHMINLWIDHEVLSRAQFASIQEVTDSIVVPSDIGRIPHKIESGFSSFKADQFKTWVNIYSIPVLFNSMAIEHLECWRLFVLACRILCKQTVSVVEVDLADALLNRFCLRVESLYGNRSITPNLHIHGHIKDVLLDYGPVHEYWLFSFERYNGLMGKQPTNNKEIEPQLMKRFLKDSEVNNLKFPQEFYKDFSSVLTSERVSKGSLSETLTPTQYDLPSKHTRDAFKVAELSKLSILLGKIHHVETENIKLNSVYLKYASIIWKGKTYFSAGKRAQNACIIQADWSVDYYGPSPSSLPDDYANANLRPCKVHYFLKANYLLNANENSLVLACVSWLKPDPHRYMLGKPAEMWSNNMFESLGVWSFLPLDKIMSRCAYGNITYDDEIFLVVVPLVE